MKGDRRSGVSRLAANFNRRTVGLVDELTQALHHIKAKIEHQIRDLARSPLLAHAQRSEESLLEQINYKKLLKSQLSDVEKAIELSQAAIRLRNDIGRGN